MVVVTRMALWFFFFFAVLGFELRPLPLEPLRQLFFVLDIF
jgi:hypothetical protein